MLLLSRSNRLLCFSFVYFFAVFAVTLYGLFRFIRTISSIRSFRYAYSLFILIFQVQYPGYSSHSISSQLRNRNSLKSYSNWLFFASFCDFYKFTLIILHWLLLCFFPKIRVFLRNKIYFFQFLTELNVFFSTNRLRNENVFSLKNLRNKKSFFFKIFAEQKKFFFLKFCLK